MWLLLWLLCCTGFAGCAEKRFRKSSVAGGALLLSLLAVLLYVTFFPKRVRELKGLCCAVTGASDGLGVFIAHALAAEGVEKLVLGARRVERLEEVKADLVNRFPKVKVLTLKLDVTDGESRNDFLRQATAFGPCQVLINNAGVLTYAFFEAMDNQAMDAMLQTNLSGTLHLTKSFLPELLKEKRAHVVNISSTAGGCSVAYGGIYAATKAALTSFTISLRLEMRLEKKPVTFHCVCPGLVEDVGMAASASGRIGATVSETGRNLGWTSPTKVAQAVVRAIQYDEAQVLVNSIPLQPLFAIAACLPEIWELTSPLMGALGFQLYRHLRRNAELGAK
ncbi:hetN [Symbiodinium necroappetens]|uniref:HetN protein n=1 Tax=Symbiodinium necroappetens TaxID=1628268 RepID=A0A812UR42_9DINO|nr:hetN [Symbiodinium necroappetens]